MTSGSDHVKESATAPRISVCVVSRHRPGQLDACLWSVAAQVDAPRHEVLVCANDDVEVEQLVAKRIPGATVVHTPLLHPGAARNTLIDKASGDLILFVDDDVVLDVRLLARLDRLAEEHPGADVFGGPNITPPDSSPFEVTEGNVLGSLVGAGPVRYRYARHPASAVDDKSLILCNLAFRRSALQRFPAELSGGEENALLFDLAGRGVAMRYDPDLVVYHRRRADTRSFVRQMYKYGHGRAQAIRRRPSSARLAYVSPSLLLLYLVALPLLLSLSTATSIPLGLYVLMVLGQGAVLGSRSGPREFALGVFLIVTLHISYGAGVLAGLVGRGAAVGPVRADELLEPEAG